MKQYEEQQAAVNDALHEATKPLARAKDDQDMDEMLKDRDREDDPMLEYMKKKKQKAKGSKKAELQLGQFHLKEYGRGGRLFFQTLPPSLSPPVQFAQWAHMHHFLSVCQSVCQSVWTGPKIRLEKIHISESIIARSLKLYHNIKL